MADDNTLKPKTIEVVACRRLILPEKTGSVILVDGKITARGETARMMEIAMEKVRNSPGGYRWP